ncbi:MAG: hypothetical protein SVU32_06805, partial [Candidatus Nanohaloarchaea archaeon]|nr:hypothetical protein [Candidatus Nanohaloarchaea archaeon]
MDDPVTLTKELVRFQTAPENDDEIRRCLDYIASQFSSESFDVRRHEHDGVASLMITFGDDDPEVILHGHIDVVAADEDMYEPEERDGKLFGRGTAD